MAKLLDMIWSFLKLGFIGAVIWLGSCQTTRTILKQAPLETPTGWLEPLQISPPTELEKQLLQTELYGDLNLTPSVTVRNKSTLDAALFDGQATLIQYELTVDYGAATRPLDLIALLPNKSETAPIILSQNFCPNNNVVPLSGVKRPEESSFDCSDGGLSGALMTSLFGRYIVTPPLEDILDRGYGFAAIYPSQFVPDSAQAGLATLDRLFPDHPNRPGALSVWANLFDVMATILMDDFNDRSMIAYGHSRFGKTALMAAAKSDHIDGAIAHQSGTLGASSLIDGTGEPLGALIESYPHWPGPRLQSYVDQAEKIPVRPAHLLALSGNKPILLGNARRDVWSDPWGAFTEAKAAWGDAFAASEPADFRPKDKKAYWIRPGTHGVVKEDWPAFLDFLDAHFKDAE